MLSMTKMSYFHNVKQSEILRCVAFLQGGEGHHFCPLPTDGSAILGEADSSKCLNELMG